MINIDDLPMHSQGEGEGEGGFVPGGSVDPNEFNQHLADITRPDEPTIRPPDSGYVELEYGVEIEGEMAKDVIVRELNGADEEHLAKISQTKVGSAFFVLVEDAVIRRATETIGGVKATKDLLDRLLIADRGRIFTQILISTFGEVRSYEGMECPSCGALNDIDVDIPGLLKYTPMRTEAPEATVKLRGNPKYPHVKSIVVRYPTGADQLHIYQEKKDASEAEINTAMLARCVKHDSVPDRRDFALSLGLADRKAAIKAIYDNQPSMSFEEVPVHCTSCNEAIPFVFGWADLLFN